jgi:hypothetical protein
MKLNTDLIGKSFSRLTIVGLSKIEKQRTKVICICSCGKTVIVHFYSLASGNTKSCGCLHKEAASLANKSHGLTSTRTYRIWENMKTRCLNKNSPSYPRNGGRGIIFCDRWFSFDNFLSDMGECGQYETIERKDNDAGYSKDNCVWATNKEQANNKRNSRKITYMGDTLTHSQWSEKLGHKGVVEQRIRVLKWDEEKSVSTPVKKRKLHIKQK